MCASEPVGDLATLEVKDVVLPVEGETQPNGGMVSEAGGEVYSPQQIHETSPHDDQVLSYGDAATHQDAERQREDGSHEQGDEVRQHEEPHEVHQYGQEDTSHQGEERLQQGESVGIQAEYTEDLMQYVSTLKLFKCFYRSIAKQ
jgi:hypothetical protein